MQTKYTIIVGILILIGIIITVVAIKNPEIFSTFKEEPELLKSQLSYAGTDFKPSETCTPISQTTCDGTTCTLSYRGYTHYINQDGDSCTPITEARSLVGSGIIPKTKEDKSFPIAVTDYNWTSITTELRADSKEFDKDIPIRIFKIDYSKISTICESAVQPAIIEACKDPYNYSNTLAVSNFYDIKVNTTERFSVISPSKTREYTFGKDYVMIYGFNSTIVTLQDANSENLKDAGSLSTQTFYNYGTNLYHLLVNFTTRREFLITFNLTDAIPAGQVIENASLFFWIESNNIDINEAINVSAVHVYHNYTTTLMDLHPTTGNSNSMGFCKNASEWYASDVTDARIYKYYASNGTYMNVNFLTTASGFASQRGLDCNESTINETWVYGIDDADADVYAYWGNGSWTKYNYDLAGDGNTNPYGIAHNSSTFATTDVSGTQVYFWKISSTPSLNFNGSTVKYNFDTASAGCIAPYNIFWFNDSDIGTVHPTLGKICVWSTAGVKRPYNYTLNTTEYSRNTNSYDAEVINSTDIATLDNSDAQPYFYDAQFNLRDRPMYSVDWIEGTEAGATSTKRGSFTFSKIPDKRYTDNQFGVEDYSTPIEDTNVGWYGWNVTNAIQNEYTEDNENVTFYLLTWQSNLNSAIDTIIITSKENATANAIKNRPMLNITYTAGGETTCNPASPFSANYEWDCADNCIESSSINAMRYNISITGSGSLTLLESIFNISRVTIKGNCKVHCSTAKCFNA